MRIALLTARPPYPPDGGGRIRILQLLKRVSQVHRVTLYTVAQGESGVAELEQLRQLLPDVRVRSIRVRRRDHPAVQLRSLLCTLTKSIPYPWAHYKFNAFSRMVSSELERGTFDLVHCDQIQMAYAVRSDAALPRVLTAHNVESRLASRLAAVEGARWPPAILRWQARKVLAAEVRALTEFSHCVAVSDTDRDALCALAPGLRVSVVSNGVDLDHFFPSPVDPSSRTLAFCGDMGWAPNVDAVTFFVREVLPRIRQVLPEVTFSIIGRGPSDALVRSLSSDSVRFSGTVPDVRPLLSTARLVVVPLRSGSGTRLKILEAWAAGRPVLSTTVGAEGLPVAEGQNIVIADDAETMARRAIFLLNDLSLSSRLGENGRRLVESRFGWDTVAESLLELYESALTSYQPRTRPPVLEDPEWRLAR